MHRLEIHLQQGFVVDDVIVRVNGHEVVERLAVTTNPTTGLAEVIHAEAAKGKVRVRFAIPSRGIVADLTLDASLTPFLGVRLAPGGGALEMNPAALPFGYSNDPQK